jgi:hypothetical protein
MMGAVAAPKTQTPMTLEHSTCGGSAKQHVCLCQSRFVFGQITRCRYHSRQKPFSSRLWVWLDEFEFGRTRDDGQRQPCPHCFQPIFIPMCVSKRIPSVSTAVFFRLGIRQQDHLRKKDKPWMCCGRMSIGRGRLSRIPCVGVTKGRRIPNGRISRTVMSLGSIGALWGLAAEWLNRPPGSAGVVGCNVTLQNKRHVPCSKPCIN